MSSLADVIELPVREEYEERDSLEHDLVLALATADDLASGMDAVVGRIRRDSGGREGRVVGRGRGRRARARCCRWDRAR